MRLMLAPFLRHARAARWLSALSETIGSFRKKVAASSHRFCFGSFRSRTPGPPPFSSMNSTPADSKFIQSCMFFFLTLGVYFPVTACASACGGDPAARAVRPSALRLVRGDLRQRGERPIWLGGREARTSECAGNIFRGSARLESRAGSATFFTSLSLWAGLLEPDAGASASVLIDRLDTGGSSCVSKPAETSEVINRDPLDAFGAYLIPFHSAIPRRRAVPTSRSS
jgi:hypothetical protein